MINKVIHIKNVGKFTDYSVNTTPTWNGEFKPITLIYGQNGIGKTTFTSILKSLKDNDALLYQLRTFGTINSPEVSMKISNHSAPIRYANAEWDENISEIEIFDIHFINDNVYTGFEILPQHKKNLFEIIIGQEGIRLKKEISDIKTAIKKKNVAIKTIEANIFKVISGFDINTIVNFQNDTEVDKKIAEKTLEIETAKATEKIKSTAILKRISRIDFDIRFEKVIEFLHTSIDSISEEYLKMVSDHKNTLKLNNKSEQWIKDGYDNISENKCPFCLRFFDDTVEIINAYKQYFNEEYISLQEKTKLLQNKIKTLNPELILSNIEKENNHNIGYSEFWSNYIKKEITGFSVSNQNENIIVLTEKLKNLVDEKASNPIKEVKTDEISELKAKIDEINNLIDAYNIKIEDFNENITELKNKDSKNLLILENELQKLQAIKTRHTNDDVKLDCQKYINEQEELEKLKNINTKLQDELKKYSRETFDKYRGVINTYLQKFASYLEIREMKSTYKGGGDEPFAEYGLFVAGNKVNFKDNSNSPSLKYCLSEGDKTALALSFFLAKLHIDTEIENKIIVFDDPISSFDIERKNSTISQLYSIGQRANQLIVLTHNLLFAKEFWDKVKNSCQVLKLCELRKSTQIIDYDIENETLNGLFKDYSVLDSFLTNGVETDLEKRNVARCIRPILEGYFRIKFYGEFSPHQWLGDFLEKIDKCVEGHPLYQLKDYTSDLHEINDFSKKFHHTNPNSDSEPIYDGELKTYVERTFQIISKI
jgi:wobble nucleotide-excising tRNase